MPLLSKIHQDLRGPYGPFGVKVDQDIIEDHGQMDSSSAISLHQSKSKAEEYRFACPAAQNIDRDPFSLGRIDQEFRSNHAGPESLVPPSSNLFEVN